MASITHRQMAINYTNKYEMEKKDRSSGVPFNLGVGFLEAS
jgi:hypothetical protein